MFTYYNYSLESAIECAKKIASVFCRIVYVYQEDGKYMLTQTAVDNPVITIGGAS